MQDLNLSQEFTVRYTPSKGGVKPKKEPHDVQGVDLRGKRQRESPILW